MSSFSGNLSLVVQKHLRPVRGVQIALPTCASAQTKVHRPDARCVGTVHSKASYQWRRYDRHEILRIQGMATR